MSPIIWCDLSSVPRSPGNKAHSNTKINWYQNIIWPHEHRTFLWEYCFLSGWVMWRWCRRPCPPTARDRDEKRNWDGFFVFCFFKTNALAVESLMRMRTLENKWPRKKRAESPDCALTHRFSSWTQRDIQVFARASQKTASWTCDKTMALRQPRIPAFNRTKIS